jgi:hypothetical protein
VEVEVPYRGLTILRGKGLALGAQNIVSVRVKPLAGGTLPAGAISFGSEMVRLRVEAGGREVSLAPTARFE